MKTVRVDPGALEARAHPTQRLGEARVAAGVAPGDRGRLARRRPAGGRFGPGPARRQRENRQERAARAYSTTTGAQVDTPAPTTTYWLFEIAASSPPVAGSSTLTCDLMPPNVPCVLMKT